jgi:hypothetical protein
LLFIFGCGTKEPTLPIEESALSVNGSTRTLKKSAIVPTLDTPIPEKSSAIWSSAFEFAWSRYQSKFFPHGGLSVEGTNASRIPSLPFEELRASVPKNAYATLVKHGGSGAITEGDPGLLKLLLAEEARLGGGETNQNVVSAIVEGFCVFTHKFHASSEGMKFRGSSGEGSNVSCFGLRGGDAENDEKCREQIRVLFGEREFEHSERLKSFGLDLCTTSEPFQLIVARIDRKKTLKEMVDEIEERTAALDANRLGSSFSHNDEFSVPNMHWRLEHHFEELEGPTHGLRQDNLLVANLNEASETIQFRLDHSGAHMTARARETTTATYNGPRYFTCDGPYLLILKMRNATVPVFVMWVDNAELMEAHL